MKSMIALALLAGATLAHAQSASAPAAAPVSAAKKELVAKVIALQAPILEAMAREMIMRPVMQMGQAAGQALQNVPQDKRESAAKTIDADIRKFVDEAVPLLRERANKVAPATLGPILEEKMNEDELKQLVAWLDSGAAKKYQQIGGDLQQAMQQKLLAEASPLLTPKLQALEQKVRVTLGVPPPAGAASGAGPAKPAAAKPASKAASK
ncbi:MAG TPA: DUF2059 domain-containing protein [Burkholderiaceae bacterium]|nr:DUF2059 domain-containing protein [Burkholderiaceae bacterium]